MESFEIPVIYKGENLTFEAELLAYAYSYKIQVEVNGLLVLFELDDENNYRATAADPTLVNKFKTDPELIKVIALAIEEILK